uniref:Sm domain-containing protein n=1 Tax=Oncorhynchus tshawytscha TaxID=74940 RepID=A0AAZ3PJD1_ONCTS
MEVSHSIRERTIAENSLVILLQGLQGEVTTVDLRDESTARGRVVNVDAFMNVRLEEVIFGLIFGCCTGTAADGSVSWPICLSRPGTCATSTFPTTWTSWRPYRPS